MLPTALPCVTAPQARPRRWQVRRHPREGFGPQAFTRVLSHDGGAIHKDAQHCAKRVGINAKASRHEQVMSLP